MANPILGQKADASVKAAIKRAFKDKSFSFGDLFNVLIAAADGGTISDVEFRDLKRFMRKEKRISWYDRFVIEVFLGDNYKLKGPHLYPGDIDLLEGAAPLGSHECAAIVQSSQPIGLTKTWREGIPVRGNGGAIKKGTAIATFEDGFYANRSHDNHVAYYLSQDARGIRVMDQWSGKATITSRNMPFKGQLGSGLFKDPSNNGDALSVIMTK